MKHTVIEHTLPTGTKGLLIDVAGSNVVNITLFFRAGFQFGDFSKYEIPHLIEHHIFSTTKKYPANNAIMAQFTLNGAHNNAFTSPNYIGYTAECAEFEVERILELMIEVITRPLFPKKFYASERENVRTELTGNLSDYGRKASLLAMEASYPDLVLNYQTRLDQLDSITHDDVVGHYHATHQALNANFVITGATKANEAMILRKLGELYAALPAGTRRELLDNIGIGSTKPILAVEAIDSIYFNLSWFQGGLTVPERVTGNLMRSILTGGFASRIYGKARDEGLTYHIYSSQDASTQSSSFMLGGFCNPAQFDRLLELIAIEIDDIVTNGPSEDELEAAKRRIVGSITLGSQTAGAVSGWYAGDYVLDGSVLSYEDYFRHVEAVTTDEVKRIAEHYFRSERHGATLVGKVGQSETEAVDHRLRPIWH